MAKTCEEYIINELISYKEDYAAMEKAYKELEKRHSKEDKVVEIIKKHAKIQYGSVWIGVYDTEDCKFLIEALELKEEEKPNE